MPAPTTGPAAKLWRLHDLQVEAWFRAGVTSFAKHSHDEWQVARTVAGASRWWVPRTSGDATPADLVVVPPGEVHASGTPDGADWTLKSFYIPDAAFRRVRAGLAISGGGDGARAAPPVLGDPRLVAWFDLLWEVATGPATLLERSSALTGLIAALEVRGGRRGAEPPVVGAEARGVARAREFLHAYPAEKVDLADLAEVAGLDPFRLNRAFRRAVGVPPHAYQVQLRVRRAEALLAEGAPIAEAADRAGFVDQSHLGRHFKRLVALSPGEYRRAARTS